MTYRIIDEGRIGSEAQLNAVIRDLQARGANKATVAEDTQAITHWWLLEADGKLLMYFGTPESLAKHVI